MKTNVESGDLPQVEPPVVVFKFGGSSVGSPETFRNVVAVVSSAAEHGRVVVIASALARVTRQLSSALDAYTTRTHDRDAVVDDLIETLRERHTDHAKAALEAGSQSDYEALMEQHLARLRGVFDRVRRDGFSPALRDAVLAMGEQMSVPLLALALRDAGIDSPHTDATRLVVTDDAHGAANVDLEATPLAVRQWYADLPEHAVPVLAGFIGATHEGATTTLGFEGSDYSAALFASLLGAQGLTRYTDVDGLYTDDPNTNDDARRLERISMEQAFALTESGALGMHPKTLRPLVEAGIPMQVRSILDPFGPGTAIVPEGVHDVRLIPERG